LMAAPKSDNDTWPAIFLAAVFDFPIFNKADLDIGM